MMRNKNFILSLKEKENVNVPLSTPRNFDDFIPFEIQKSFIHTCPSSSPQLPPTNPRPPLDPPPPVRRVTGQRPSVFSFPR